MSADLRYPVGKFTFDGDHGEKRRREWIDQVREAPARLRAAVDGLSASQLDTPYREGGWTLRQVAHHVPDSHLNAYTRFKLALTEDEPTIKPYLEARWAELPDVKATPVEVSLDLLAAIHRRWLVVIEAMGDKDFDRTYRHPEHANRVFRLGETLALYAWHGRHHVAHVTETRKRLGW